MKYQGFGTIHQNYLLSSQKLLAVFSSNLTFYPDGDINPGKYCWVVRAKSGWGEDVKEVCAGVPRGKTEPPPPSPANLKAEVEDGKVKLTWSDKGGMGFKILRYEEKQNIIPAIYLCSSNCDRKDNDGDGLVDELEEANCQLKCDKGNDVPEISFSSSYLYSLTEGQLYPTELTVIYSKIENEEVLEKLCQETNVDFSKEFVLLIGLYQTYHGIGDWSLIKSLKVNDKLYIKIVPQAECVHLQAIDTYMAWSLVIVPKEYINKEIVFYTPNKIEFFQYWGISPLPLGEEENEFSSKEDFIAIGLAPEGATSYVDERRENEGKYCYRVQAYGKGGDSGFSNKVCVSLECSSSEEEICDGKDNDCDGKIDEVDFSVPFSRPIVPSEQCCLSIGYLFRECVKTNHDYPYSTTSSFHYFVYRYLLY